MKNIHIYCVLFLGITAIFQSCKKYDGDSYDFSNKKNNYIRPTPGQNIVVNSVTMDSIIGADTFFYYVQDVKNFNTETRMAFDEDINFLYNLTASNGLTGSLSGQLKKYSTSKKLPIKYDGSKLTINGVDFTTSDSVVIGKLTLASANGPSQGALTIGYPLSTSNNSIPFTANKPNILHHY